MFEFLFGRRYRNLERQTSILGHRLGIPYTRSKGGWKPYMNNFPYIQGTLLDRAFEYRTYRKGNGKNKRYFTEFSLEVGNKYEYTLTVYKERLWSKIGSLLGMQDIEIGDPPFDKSFVIKANDDYFAQEVLKDQRLKEYFMLILPGFDGTFTFEGNEIGFKQQGMMLSDRDRTQIEHTIEVAIVLAEKIEKFAYDRDPTIWKE